MVHEHEADATRELCDAFAEDRPTRSRPHWPDAPSHLTQYRKQSTLANWMYYCTQYAMHVDELLDCTTTDINQVAEDLLHGNSPHKDDSGLAQGSIRAYQTAIRMFYRYHGDDVDGVEHARIEVFDQEDTSVDPNDMLDSEEVQSIRDAPTSPRDKCIVDMLLYAGLRNNGLRTLRVGDVDPHEGVFRFNVGADGLKDVYKPNVERPLLGAAGTVADWLDYHPYSDDPDAYLVTGKPKWNTVDPHEPVSDRTIERVMNMVKEEAGVDKPLHPHMLRHNFVSICKRDYGLDDDTVRFLIGHAPGSRVMESTYSHLSAADYREKAEVAAGIREEDTRSPLTPDFCPKCNEPVPTDDAAFCSRCGHEFTPDSQDFDEQLELLEESDQ
jgi:integrase/recombinase XerD